MIYWYENDEIMMFMKEQIIKNIKNLKTYIGDSEDNRKTYAYICMQIISEMVRK